MLILWDSVEFENLDELWAWVESFIGKGVKKGVSQGGSERAELRALQFRALCEELGLPQAQLRSIHVAGSKGKGQTSSYIAYGLCAAGANSGRRVGLFSSPHVHSYSERIQVLQAQIDPATNSGTHPPSHTAGAAIQPGHHMHRYFNGMSLQSAATITQGSTPLISIVSADISATLLRQGSRLRRDLARFRWACDWDEAGGDKLWCRPNFFAILTLLAFRSFAALACDWVVLETGIGGRLCPTNTVLPELSVLTPIELEHTDLLGDRLELVAGEKAAIIKSGRPCISARQYAEVEAVLRARSNGQQSPLYGLAESLPQLNEEHLGPIVSSNRIEHMDTERRDSVSLREIFWRPRKFTFQFESGPSICRRGSVYLRGCSRTQLDNLSLALLGLDILGVLGAQTVEWISQGLQHSRVPGRFASYWLEEQQCLLLFDGAHTPVSCQRLLEDLQDYLYCYLDFAGKQREEIKLGLLFGAVRGKKFHEMANILSPHFDYILLTRAGTFKENDLNSLQKAFELSLQTLPQMGLKSGGKRRLLPVVTEPRQALQTLLDRKPELILICGSFYLLGELLPGGRTLSG